MALPDFYALTMEDWDVVSPGLSGFLSATASKSYVYGNNGPGVNVYGGATPDYIEKDLSSVGYASGWAGIEAVATANLSSDRNFIMLRANGTPLFGVQIINITEHWKCVYWNGSAWVQFGATNTASPLSSNRRLDFSWNIADSGGYFRVYLGGALYAEFTGDTLLTAETEIDAIRCTAVAASSNQSQFGPLFVDANDTRKTFYLDASTTNTAGGSSDYTGSENSIDEGWAVGLTTDIITFDANGEKGDWVFTGLDAAMTDGWAVEAVVLGIKAKAVADPGLYLQGYARQGGTDRDAGGYIQPLAGDWAHYKFVIENDPSTAAPWANKSAVEAANFGLHAKTTP